MKYKPNELIIPRTIGGGIFITALYLAIQLLLMQTTEVMLPTTGSGFADFGIILSISLISLLLIFLLIDYIKFLIVKQ